MKKHTLKRAIDTHYDVVIIGSGINGAGTFRDLCLQGLKCLLIDKSDFGSGTSAAPSRLIHGGLKYIETGEFRLVAESTLERNLLLKNASHYVKPLQTFVPATSYLRGFLPSLKTFLGRPTPMKARGALLIKVGLSLYDWYGRRERTMPAHSMMFGKKVRSHMSALSSKVVALGSYYDALITQPERLVLELIEDGLKASKRSHALNYAPVISSSPNSIIIEDQLTGERVNCHSDLVINASGPWIDQVNKLLGENTDLIGGNKGSHILLNHPELVAILGDKMVYFEGEDSRILLAFVYHGKVLVGSTDTPSSDPDTIRCTDDEVSYFLDCLNQLFPDLKLSRDQIVFTYSGIRPLPNTNGTEPGMVSRDHSMPTHEATQDRRFSILSLVGGKWTTFRAFSEEVSDEVLKRLNKTRVSSSRHIEIGGGKGFPDSPLALSQKLTSLHSLYGLATEHIESLINRYGAQKCEKILADMSQEELSQPTMIAGLLLDEIKWVCNNERVHHLDDFILRRTELGYKGIDGKDVQDLSEVISKTLNWSSENFQNEQERFREIMAKRHSMKWDNHQIKYDSAK